MRPRQVAASRGHCPSPPSSHDRSVPGCPPPKSASTS